MARVGIVFGLLLCGLTVVGMVVTSIKSPTQFIPMMLGIPILFCGVVALNPHRRRHAMQAAAVVGFLGAFFGGISAVYSTVELLSDEAINHYSWSLLVAMAATCTIFLIICSVNVWSARRRWLAGGDDSPAAFELPKSPSNKTPSSKNLLNKTQSSDLTGTSVTSSQKTA